MNKVILMGRLTRDPEVRYSQGDNSTAVARYSLAVDRRFSRNEENNTDFINIVVFGKGAEFAEKYLKKGTKVLVTGRIQTGSYQKDGQTIYTTDVVAEDQEFAESKASADNYNSSQGAAPIPAYTAPAPSQASPAPVSGSADGDFINIPEGLDEELPFK